MIDLQLDNFESLAIDIVGENRRQLIKWGVQEADISEWMMWLTEEVGELAEACSDLKYDHDGIGKDKAGENVTNEAIQVATLAIKIAEMVSFGDCESEDK